MATNNTVKFINKQIAFDAIKLGSLPAVIERTAALEEALCKPDYCSEACFNDLWNYMEAVSLLIRDFGDYLSAIAKLCNAEPTP
jgi:hypothetical protein